MTIVELLLRTLEQHDVRFIFGNPGTTEIPLVRACEQLRTIEYVVALSEVSAVPMADGYARATQSLAVVNLHVAPGLGNGMGGLYTAGIAQTPLLVLIGGQDRRFLHTQPILWGPLERMAGAVTKAVFSLGTTYDAPFSIRRALRAVLTPPFAPVALICPPDLLEQEVEATVQAVNPPTLSGLSLDDAEYFAQVLMGAAHPAIIAAEDVHWNRAAEPLEQLAIAVGAPVYAAPYTAALPVSSASECYAGYLPPSWRQISDRLAQHDVLFFVGGRGIRTTLHSEVHLPQTALWIGNDPAVLTADGEFARAVVADTRAALVAIGSAVVRRASGAGGSTRWRPRLDLPVRVDDAFHPTRAVHALLEAFPDAVWVDESGLSTSDVRQWIEVAAGEYFINGSGGIGWGLAASVGVAIGRPDRQVVAVIGDGSALYASEAMWTAAHHGTQVLLVVLANRRYATLNEAASRLVGRQLESFTIEPPVLDFSGLARLYGWRYQQVASESALEAFLTRVDGRVNENTLLEVVLDAALIPVTASRHF